MRQSQRRCGACGAAGPSWARFCGHCGELLTDATSDAAGAPAEASATARQQHQRSRRELVVVAGAIGVLGIAGIVVFGDTSIPRGSEPDGEVALPDDDEVDEATARLQPAPSTDPLDNLGDLELECLVEAPCERWRTDVADLELQDPFRSVSEAGDGLLLIHGRRGVGVMDEAGQWQWRRLLDNQEVESAEPVGDGVLLATDDTRWHLLDVTDGAVRWSVQDEPEPVNEHGLDAIAALASGDLVLSLERGEVAPDAKEPPVMRAQVRNRHDGELLWERLDRAQLNLARGRVLVSDGEQVHGLDALTGEPVWVATPPESRQEEVPDHPYTGMGSLQVGFDATTVLLTSAAGPVGGEMLLLDTATGEALAVLDGRPVPAIDLDPQLLVLDAFPTGAPTGPGDRTLQAVGRDGETRWTLDLDPLLDPESSGTRSSGHSVHGRLLLQSEQTSQGEKRIRLVDLVEGHVIHEADWGHGEPRRALEPHVIEVMEGSGATAVTIDDGTPLWRLDGIHPPAARVPGASVFLDDSDLVAVEHDPGSS